MKKRDSQNRIKKKKPPYFSQEFILCIINSLKLNFVNNQNLIQLKNCLGAWNPNIHYNHHQIPCVPDLTILQ